MSEAPTLDDVIKAVIDSQDLSLSEEFRLEAVVKLYAPHMAELQALRQRVGNQRLAAQSLLKELDEQKSKAMQDGMVDDWSFIVSETNGVKMLMRALGLELEGKEVSK